MGQASTGRFAGLSVGNARGALLGAASVVVVTVAVGLVATGVTSAEVAATVLFLPVFAAGLLGRPPAGYAAAIAATILYVVLRGADLASAGGASAGVLVLTRAGAYLVAGHVGSLARALLPGGAGVGAGAAPPLPGRRAPAAADRRGTGLRAASARPAGPPPQGRWDAPWPDEFDQDAYERGRPVLAGVGSARGGASVYGDGDGYGGPPTIVSSSAWPPEPARDPWRDSDDPAPAPADERDSGAWTSPGPGWQDEGGWAGDGPPPGPGSASPWPAADGGRPPADDTWAAVQETWRRQHGVPPEEDHGAITDERAAHQQGGDFEPQGRGVGLDDARGAAPDPWGQPPPGPAGSGDTPWGQPPPDSRAEPSRGRWTPSAGADPWAPAPEAGRWGPSSGQQPAVSGDGWGAPADDRWGPSSGQQPAVSGDGWGDAAPTGGTWSQAPGPVPGGWDAGHSPADQGWDAPPGGSADQGWGAPQDQADNIWDAPAGDAWPTTGQTAAVWDDPAAGHIRHPEPSWSPPAGAGWAGAGAAAGAPAGSFGGQASPPPPAPSSYSSLPAVDPETGLWTAKFLRDRLMSERERSRRSGRPFSLVLVQVPDGPLAQLPYRRQVTLLRELGYQFVAGGVVDHLVHVPDQAQHWFAVILPDTDRSGAQVLERRLRLGIGGYLSSRGLRLRDLESASLTAPDDDPAMAAIWEGLIGPDDAGSSSMTFEY